MLGKDGGMVDDGAVFGMVDDLAGDELAAERHHVQVSFDGLVLLQNLGKISRMMITVSDLQILVSSLDYSLVLSTGDFYGFHGCPVNTIFKIIVLLLIHIFVR